MSKLSALIEKLKPKKKANPFAKEGKPSGFKPSSQSLSRVHWREQPKVMILVPTILILVALVYVFNHSVISAETDRLDKRIQSDMQIAQRYIAQMAALSTEKITTQLDYIRNDGELKAALRSRDRARFKARLTDSFAALKEKHDVTHLFFNDLTRVNVIRLHAPEVHGDLVDRVSVILAEKTGNPATGMEMNSAGEITMRVAAPMTDHVGLAGFVEMGENFENKIKSFNQVTGLESILVLNKELLEKDAWTARMKKLGLESDWDRMPNFALASQSLPFPAALATHTINSKRAGGLYAELSFNNRIYYSDAIALTDVSGRTMGYFIALRNQEDYKTDVSVNAIYHTMAYVGLAAALVLILWLAIARFEKRTLSVRGEVDVLHKKMKEREQEYEAFHQQFAQEMEEERNQLIQDLEKERTELQKMQGSLSNNQQELGLSSVIFDNSVEGIMITDAENKIVRINKMFTKITGYTEEEVLGKNPSILQSERHDQAFYQEMWSSLLQQGSWRGEIWNSRKAGDIYPESLYITVVRDENRKVMYYLALFTDLTDKKLAELRNQKMFNYDELTELPNRHMLEDNLRQILADASRQQSSVALLHLNIDRFKSVVESLGHPFGDKLLQAIADRLKALVRDSDVLARFAGDEFVIVLDDVNGEKNATMVAQKVLEGLARPFTLEGQDVYLTSSIGIAMYPSHADNRDDLIRCANIAARTVREDGGDGFCCYEEQMNQAAEQRISLESSLRHALDNEEFILYYQPQVDLKSGHIIGAEALIRWQHPERGMVFPDEYISALEDTGLIVPVGEWVLHQACQQAVNWRQAGFNQMRVSVNLSARQFRQNDLLKSINWVLSDTGLPAQCLELEITESALLHDIPATITTLNQLCELGIQISIDDFGTGYSSLSYLQRLPINKVKIDRSFIKDIGTELDDGSIAKTIISLGHNLGMGVVAEGVETKEQLEYLCENECDEMQGYYFSRPVPVEVFTRLLEKKLSLDNLDA